MRFNLHRMQNIHTLSRYLLLKISMFLWYITLPNRLYSNPNKTDTILLAIAFNEINDDLFNRLSQTGTF